MLGLRSCPIKVGLVSDIGPSTRVNRINLVIEVKFTYAATDFAVNIVRLANDGNLKSKYRSSVSINMD